MSSGPLVFLWRKFSAPFAHNTGPYEKLCEKYVYNRPWIQICEDLVPKCEERKNQGIFICRTPDKGTDARQTVR
jgi:hypothetical protein